MNTFLMDQFGEVKMNATNIDTMVPMSNIFHTCGLAPVMFCEMNQDRFLCKRKKIKNKNRLQT